MLKILYKKKIKVWGILYWEKEFYNKNRQFSLNIYNPPLFTRFYKNLNFTEKRRNIGVIKKWLIDGNVVWR